MSTPPSRYDAAEEYLVPGPSGEPVKVHAAPRRERPVRLGVHLRRDGERLDHLADRYLQDPTEFWRICDVNDALLPDALTDARRVDIPVEGT
jgi:hypothetical protein